MRTNIKIIIGLLLCLTDFSFSQKSRDMEKFGFIDLRTDSMQVPFYIDGIFIGKHPIKNPGPVLPGFHLVSYLPPELTKRYVEEDEFQDYKLFGLEAGFDVVKSGALVRSSYHADEGI